MSYTPPPPRMSGFAAASADPLDVARRVRLRMRTRHAGLLLVLVLAPAEVAIAGGLKNTVTNDGSREFIVLGAVNEALGSALLLSGLWLLVVAVGAGLLPPSGPAVRRIAPLVRRARPEGLEAGESESGELATWALAPARAPIAALAPAAILALIVRGIAEPAYDGRRAGHGGAVAGLVVIGVLLGIGVVLAGVLARRTQRLRREAARIDPAEVTGGYLPRRRLANAALAAPVVVLTALWAISGQYNARLPADGYSDDGTEGAGSSGSPGSSGSSGPDPHELTAPSLAGSLVSTDVYAYSETVDLERYIAKVVGAPTPLSSREILLDLVDPDFGNTQLDVDERLSQYATPAAAALGMRADFADDRTQQQDAPAPKPPAAVPLTGFGASAWIPQQTSGPATDLVSYRIDGSLLVRLRISPFGIPVGHADPDLPGTAARAQLISASLAVHQAALDALPPGPPG